MKKLIYLLLAVTLSGCAGWPIIYPLKPRHTRSTPKYPFRSDFPKDNRPLDAAHIVSVEEVCNLISEYLKAPDAYKNCHEIAIGGYFDASALRNTSTQAIPVIQFIPCYYKVAPNAQDRVFMVAHTSNVASNDEETMCNILNGNYFRSSGNIIYNYDPDHITPLDVQDFINTLLMNTAPPVTIPYTNLEEYRKDFFEEFYKHNGQKTNSDYCTTFRADELRTLLNQTDPVTGLCDIIGVRFFFGYKESASTHPNKMRIILVAVLSDGSTLTEYNNGTGAVMIESGWPPDQTK